MVFEAAGGRARIKRPVRD